MADFLDAVYWNRCGGWRGLTNLTAAVLLLKNRRAGAILGGIFGVTLMLWICIQFYIFPLNFMSTAYFIFGLIQTITGYAAWVFARQEDFAAQQVAYHHVGENPRRLVVWALRHASLAHAHCPDCRRSERL